MRFLIISFGLLLLANTALLFWPETASSAAHIYPPREDLNPHFIRLNKEIEEKYLAAEPAVGADSEFRIAADSGTGCFRLGPFMHKANYELAQAVLFNANIDYQKSTREAKQSNVYRVYLGPFATQALALDKRTELKRKNILDHFIRENSDGEFIISLGIYTTKSFADNAVALFDGKLDSVKLKQEDLVLPNSYWLHFAIPQGDQIRGQLSLMDWGEQSTKLGKYQCRTG